MLKLPKVGHPINDYLFLTVIKGNELDIAIVFQKKNHFGALIHELEFFVLFTDERQRSISTIKQNIDQLLVFGQGKTLETIQVDEKGYFYFGGQQYTGYLLP